MTTIAEIAIRVVDSIFEKKGSKGQARDKRGRWTRKGGVRVTRSKPIAGLQTVTTHLPSGRKLVRDVATAPRTAMFGKTKIPKGGQVGKARLTGGMSGAIETPAGGTTFGRQIGRKSPKPSTRTIASVMRKVKRTQAGTSSSTYRQFGLAPGPIGKSIERHARKAASGKVH